MFVSLLAPFQGSKSNQLYRELEKVYELEPFIIELGDITTNNRVHASI